MRSFIAVEISEEVRKKLTEFQKNLHLPGVKLVEPEQMHFTSFFLGEIDEEVKKKVAEAMDSISPHPFQIHLKGIGAFPSPNYIRVIWAGAESGGKLEELHEQLKPKIKSLGFKTEPFSAHLTLARVKTPESKNQLAAILQQFKNEDFGSCLTDHLTLFQSTLTPQGPIYVPLHTKRFQ